MKYIKSLLLGRGFALLAASVHDGDCVCLSFAPPRLCIPELVCVVKCNFARVLLLEFAQIKRHLWGGHLWSEGFAVRIAGVVTGSTIEDCINRA